MFNNKSLIMVIALSALLLISCEGQQIDKIKNEIKEEINEVKEHLREFSQGSHTAITEKNRLTEAESEELTKALGFSFTQIGFIDNRSGAVVHMINETAELTLTSDDPRIPQYKKITAINVVPVSGMVEGAQNCNYIHVDAQTALICEKSGNNNTDTSIPPIGNELIKRLETTLRRVAKVAEFEIGYVVATDAASGNAKIFRSENYVAINPALPRLPQSLPELGTPTSLYIITEKVNPCCTDVYSGGTWYRVCVKAASC
ncbi:MAG: hypothetical protein ABTQ25_11800 [Nitrosomonas ureae]